MYVFLHAYIEINEIIFRLKSPFHRLMFVVLSFSVIVYNICNKMKMPLIILIKCDVNIIKYAVYAIKGCLY